MIFINNQDKKGDFNQKKNGKPGAKTPFKPANKAPVKPPIKPPVKVIPKEVVDGEEVLDDDLVLEEGDGPTFRLRLPRGNREFIGLVEQRLGGSRMRVKCFDGNVRICRIPGRLKRRLWIRENDIVIVESWEIQGDEKGDVIYKYNKNQLPQLKSGGYLKEIEDYEEF